MRVYETFKCTKCGSIQELNSYEYKDCPNGCYSIQLHDSRYGGHRYHTSDGKSNCVESLKDRRYYLEEKDIIIPITEEIATLINDIKNFNKGKESWRKPLDIYEYNITDSTGEERLEKIKFEIRTWNKMEEMTELILEIRFIDYIYSYSDKERKNKVENITRRLNTFKDIVYKMINKDFDLNDRKYIEENIELEDVDKNQKELYDTRYYI